MMGLKMQLDPSVSASAVEMIEPIIKRQWKKSLNKDKNQSARINFNFNEEWEFIAGDQQLLFGLDLDHKQVVQRNSK